MYVIPHVIVLFVSQVFIFFEFFFFVCCFLWLLNLLVAHIVWFPVARWCCCRHHYHYWMAKKKNTYIYGGNYIVTDVCVKPQLIKQHSCMHTHSPKNKENMSPCWVYITTIHRQTYRDRQRDNKTIKKNKAFIVQNSYNIVVIMMATVMHAPVFMQHNHMHSHKCTLQ